MKAFAAVIACLVASATGFVPKQTLSLVANDASSVISPHHQRHSRLLLADQPHDDVDPTLKVKRAAINFFDVIMESPLTPTFLITAPFVNNPKIREHVPFVTFPLVVTMALAWQIYQKRVQDISYAYENRVGALSILKHRKQGQLQDVSTEEDVIVAQAAYRSAVEEELELRFFNGFAIDPPPQELIQGARLYLACDITEKGELVPIS